MPLPMAEFEALVAAKPAGTPLAEIIGVGNVYWSGSLIGRGSAVCGYQ